MKSEVLRFQTRPVKMPTLVVGPVLDAWRNAEVLIAGQAGRAKSVVFLGDYWGGGVDGDGRFESTCSWLFNSIGDYRRVHLAGPRELKLLAPFHHQVVSDGWSRYQQGIFDLVWGEAFRALIALAVRAGGWLVSNQGFGQDFVRERTADDLVALADDARWRALRGQADPLLGHWHRRRVGTVTPHYREAEMNWSIQITDRVNQVCRYRWPFGYDFPTNGCPGRAPADLVVSEEVSVNERPASQDAGGGRIVFVGCGPVEAVLLHEDGRVERVSRSGRERKNSSGRAEL